MAVHHVFDTASDRIVWEGGDQSLAHTALSAWRNRRCGHPGGAQALPPRPANQPAARGEEHCGTAIGAALGVAVAAARLGEQRHVVAVVPDGALTAGMAFEALNHAGALPADMLVILNDSDPAHCAN